MLQWEELSLQVGCRSFFLGCIAGLGVCLLAPAAHAHTGTSTEPLGIVAGFLHPLTIPAHLLAILISAILVGQQGMKALGYSVVLFSLTFILGLVLSRYYMPPREIALAFTALTILCGILVVISLKLPRLIYLPLIVAASGLVGLDSDFVASRNAVFAAGAGAFFASVFVFMNLGILVAKIYEDWPDWMQIGVRTVGSWIAAVSLLTFALMFA